MTLPSYTGRQPAAFGQCTRGHRRAWWAGDSLIRACLCGAPAKGFQYSDLFRASPNWWDGIPVRVVSR